MMEQLEGNKSKSFVENFTTLFAPTKGKKFISHRILGLLYLVQYVSALSLYYFSYETYLHSPLVWSLPLNALVQSINAAYTFTFLPKKEDPGFAAVSDKSVLSYYTVLENSFYSLQLLFACCYLSDDLLPTIRKTVFIEPLMVFFVFYMRHLWPSSRIGASLANSKNKTDANRLTLTVSTYAIKFFYLFAKHFVGTFPLYLRFLGRVSQSDQRYLYGVQMLSAYASTISIFIHTLKFKRYIGPLTAMIAYDIVIPGYAYLFWNMRHLVVANSDIAMISGVGMVLNLSPKILGCRPWFVWQAIVAYMFYTDFPFTSFTDHVDIRVYLGCWMLLAVALFRK